jgi:hypothetical protein
VTSVTPLARGTQARKPGHDGQVIQITLRETVQPGAVPLNEKCEVLF